MKTSRVFINAGFVSLCMGLLLSLAGCPPPQAEEPFEVLLINGTSNTLNVYFNAAMDNPTVETTANRIDVAAGTLATARFSEDRFSSIGSGSLQLLVSAAPGGTMLGIVNPTQVIPDHSAGTQAALLVTACGAAGEARMLPMVP